VITFDEALDAARAGNLANYRLVSPGPPRRGRPGKEKTVVLTAAVYNPAARAVTLTARGRPSARNAYRLTVAGTGPSAVADTAGRRLDGAGNGEPGSDFVALVK
jgi:hypothetical protein